MKLKEYSVYILRCNDNSLYTGIALDVAKRFEQHKNREGAKYTKVKSKHPLLLDSIFFVGTRAEACKVEAFFKKFTKKQKEYYLLNKEIFIQNIQDNLNIKIRESES